MVAADEWLATELPHVEAWRLRAASHVPAEELGERLRTSLREAGADLPGAAAEDESPSLLDRVVQSGPSWTSQEVEVMRRALAAPAPARALPAHGALRAYRDVVDALNSGHERRLRDCFADAATLVLVGQSDESIHGGGRVAAALAASYAEAGARHRTNRVHVSDGEEGGGATVWAEAQRVGAGDGAPVAAEALVMRAAPVIGVGAGDRWLIGSVVVYALGADGGYAGELRAEVDWEGAHRLPPPSRKQV